MIVQGNALYLKHEKVLSPERALYSLRILFCPFRAYFHIGGIVFKGVALAFPIFPLRGKFCDVQNFCDRRFDEARDDNGLASNSKR